jgi:hypothetical protein
MSFGTSRVVLSCALKCSDNGNHHRVAAKVVSKIERGRPATSVHGFVLAVFRARARARSIKQLYHSILVNALLGQEFGNG